MMVGIIIIQEPAPSGVTVRRLQAVVPGERNGPWAAELRVTPTPALPLLLSLLPLVPVCDRGLGAEHQAGVRESGAASCNPWKAPRESGGGQEEAASEE